MSVSHPLTPRSSIASSILVAFILTFIFIVVGLPPVHAADSDSKSSLSSEPQPPLETGLTLTPTPAPTPTPASKSAPAPVAAAAYDKKAAAQLADDLKKHCDRHYPGQIQGEIRAACASASNGYSRFGKSQAGIRCRLNYGEEPRLVLACLIGLEISDELSLKKEDFKKKLQLCAEHYPAHNEIDGFLQESCLTGVHLPTLLSEKPRLDLCTQISPERSFLSPCAVGLSLAQDAASNNPVSNNQVNRICEQYFDHRQFHTGYRACLNARSLSLLEADRFDDVMKFCTTVVSDGGNDTERAACIVGVSIYRTLSKQEDISKRFQKCGATTKVSYEDRDFLACLTAASLLDYSDKNNAQSGCKSVFKTAKSRGRSDCLSSLALFQ